MLKTTAVLAAFVLAVLPSAAGASAYEEPAWRGFFVLGGGAFYPGQSPVRAIYGDVSFPAHVQLGFRVGGQLSLTAGYRYLGLAGATRSVEPAVDDEGYDLRLVVHSVRAAFRLDSSLGESPLFVQAGYAYNFYRESWEGVDQVINGRAGGVFFAAGAEIPVSWPLAVQIRLEYALVPTKKGGLFADEVDLGGFDAVIGLVFRFGRPR
jgi:hypothetical protein